MAEVIVRGASPARIRLLDLGIALALCGLALLFLGPHLNFGESGTKARDAVGVFLVVAMTLPLAWREVAPRTVLVVTYLAWMTDRSIGYRDTVAMLGLVVAIHAVGALLPARKAYVWGASTLAVATGWTVLGLVWSSDIRWVHVMVVVLTVSIPFALGRADALSRERVAALETAYRGTARAQREATDVAIRTERARIARELHDVVAHEITVMTLQAEGARRALGDANPAITEALQTIGDSGRKGLAEMNRMIGVLRDTSESGGFEATVGTSHAPAAVTHLDPMPALASLPALAAQVEDAGLPVDLHVTGTARVPAGVELSAYRIVQESLTNALKHAGPGARATVAVLREAGAVTIRVEDDGRGVTSESLAIGGGHGLAGMHERVIALGGSIEMGPRPGGGFRVRAILPSHDDTVVTAPRPTRVAADPGRRAPKRRPS